MKRRDVQVGGRVWLHLCEAPPGLVRGQFVRVSGTVVEFDEPGLPPGVRVQLDRTVNGADQCYATYTELHPLRCTPQQAR